MFMFKNIHQLAELHLKIQEGIATDEEKSIYQIGIGTSCLDETILVEEIEREAREIKRNRT